MKLVITTSEGGTWFKPGEMIAVNAEWYLDGPAEAIEVRLFWYTEGTGTQDVGVVQTQRVEDPEDQRQPVVRDARPQRALLLLRQAHHSVVGLSSWWSFRTAAPNASTSPSGRGRSRWI